jgi:hypothetical protein
VKNSAEAFPVCVSPFSLTVHYSEVGQEVKGQDNQFYDVSSDVSDFSDATKSIQIAELKISPVIKVSVSFDVAKIDELAAL